MKKPSRENIDAAKQLRNELLFSWKSIDELLYNEFRRLNKNVNQSDVAYKATLVDSLYGCKLPVNAEEFVNEIIKAEIDNKLSRGDSVTLVEKIASCSVPKFGKMRRNNLGITFASKYCHFHQPDKFAIYDQYAWYALKNISGNIPERNYRLFKQAIDDLKPKLHLSYKKIDEYLWIYGQWLRHREGKTIIWIRNAESKFNELFLKLAP